MIEQAENKLLRWQICAAYQSMPGVMPVNAHTPEDATILGLRTERVYRAIKNGGKLAQRYFDNLNR